MKTRRSILSLCLGTPAFIAGAAVAWKSYLMGRGYDYRTVTQEQYEAMISEEFWRIWTLPEHVARKANLSYAESREAAKAYHERIFGLSPTASECAGYAPASRSASECSKG